MNRLFSLLVVAAAINLTACSKHSCDFDTDAEKEALGDAALIAAQNGTCRVSGTASIQSFGRTQLMQGMTCTIGDDGCVPTLDIYYSDTTQAAASEALRARLAEHQWRITKDEVSETEADEDDEGATITTLIADRAGKRMVAVLGPFGDSLIQAKLLVTSTPSARE